MTYLFKLAQRTARLRALSLVACAAALSACDTDRLTNSSEEPLAPAAEPFTPSTPLLAESFRGGIPFGIWVLPTSQFGPVYNGAQRNIHPSLLLSELAAIKSRGGRVILTFTGNERYFKDSQGHFSLSMWKERVNRYKGINFNSFVEDGTIIGHYLIDEPNDPFNWNGQPVPGSMVETMAQYSKSLWPNLATVVRAEPGYLAKTGGPYRYLDAAWAQYVARKGEPDDYIRRNVEDAQRIGVALVAGLNITKGGPTGGEMSASLVQSAGSIILANSYPCAFLSWEWRDAYMARADIKAAMAVLSNKAEAHAARSCGGSGGIVTPPPPPPPSEPLPGISGIVLRATKVVEPTREIVNLAWSGAAGTSVKLYVNNVYRRTTANDGKGYVYPQRSGTYSFKICEVARLRCSNTSSVTIR